METIVDQIQSKYSLIDNVCTNFWKSWIKSGNFVKIELKNIKWKNKKASPGTAYVPTEVEHVANVITHGLWVIPAIFAACQLVTRAHTPGQQMVAWVYGSALSLLFLVSTFFHCVFYCNRNRFLKDILHRCDRAMIYVFIAGSYFPWLELENTTRSGVLISLQWIIWVMAALGIIYQQMYHERFKCLETCFYIIIGLGPALVMIFTGHDNFDGMTELKIGGLFYISGICFFKADGVIPLAHAIWHLFVVLAAGFHYYAILKNLFPLTPTIEQLS